MRDGLPKAPVDQLDTGGRVSDKNDDWLGGFLVCYFLYLGFWIVLGVLFTWLVL